MFSRSVKESFADVYQITGDLVLTHRQCFYNSRDRSNTGLLWTFEYPTSKDWVHNGRRRGEETTIPGCNGDVRGRWHYYHKGKEDAYKSVPPLPIKLPPQAKDWNYINTHENYGDNKQIRR